MLSRQPLLADENAEEYDALAAALFEQLAPAPGVEELLVDEVVATLWRLQRLRKVEVGLFSLALPQPVLEALRRSGETDSGLGMAFNSMAASFSVLSRYESTMGGRLRRSLDDLERLQQARETTANTLVVIDGER